MANHNAILAFSEHYENNKPLKTVWIDSWIYNILTDSQEPSEFVYAGVSPNNIVGNIKCWTTCYDTAKAFSNKHNNGIVISMRMEDFRDKFNFISMDVLAEQLKVHNYGIDYVSENELYVTDFKK